MLLLLLKLRMDTLAGEDGDELMLSLARSWNAGEVLPLYLKVILWALNNNIIIINNNKDPTLSKILCELFSKK